MQSISTEEYLIRSAQRKQKHARYADELHHTVKIPTIILHVNVQRLI